MQSIRKHLTYSNVMATLGVFLALGGTAVAFQFGKNSVKSRNIAKGAVKTSDIAKGAVSKAKLKANAIGSNVIADGSVKAKQLGPVVVRKAILPLPDNGNPVNVTVFCKPGERAIAGGGRTFAAGSDISLEASHALGAGGSLPEEGEGFDGWGVWAHNLTGANPATSVQADVICLQ